MLRLKNLSAVKLSFFTALLLSAAVALIIFFLVNKIGVALLIFAFFFLSSYLLIFYVVKNFIERKIKLIYKLIYQTKATRREETFYKYVLPEKSIDEVRKEVEEWSEQESRELEMLKKNENFRKEFLQNLSHELKTPVFALQGYLDLLAGDGLQQDQKKNFLKKAEKNLGRLITLLQDLDAISKLERGEIKLLRQHFIIQDVVKEVFDSFSLQAEQCDMQLAIKKGCDNPLTVYADKEKIRQVITNLVDNSMKYGKKGGHITASMYQVDDAHVLFELSDDGIGIPEEAISRIFERFYRVNHARNQSKGSGLGLSICKHIIEAHGHSIHVRSTENVGTTIGFTLAARKNN